MVRQMWYYVFMATTVTLRIDEDLLRRAQELADAKEWSRNHWLCNAIERVVRGEESKHGS